jgi:proteic killer suppression protein
LKKVCENYSKAQKKYGIAMASKIHQRINEIEAANSVDMLVSFGIGRCHQLSGNRKGEYAMDLVHPYRLIIEQVNEKIEFVRIINIEDYH